MREKILELLSKRGDLPPFPEIVLRLRVLLRDPDVKVANIAKLIELEPVLAGRILKLSNSVYYSRSPKQITSLPLAITKLGFTLLFRMVFSLKLITLFSGSAVLDSHKFWRHSLAVAVFTQALSRRVKAPKKEHEIAYLAGLMHDVGIMVFVHLVPDEYFDFLHGVGKVEQPLEVQEKNTFGIDHPELGALFIETWWNIEEQVSSGVRFHHFPFHGGTNERRCAQLVSISNGICNNQGITQGINCYRELFRDSAWDELGLSIADAESILSDVRTSLEEAEEFLGQGKQ
jgi:HD-like signal output (HDOD) protein